MPCCKHEGSKTSAFLHASLSIQEQSHDLGAANKCRPHEGRMLIAAPHAALAPHQQLYYFGVSEHRSDHQGRPPTYVFPPCLDKLCHHPCLIRDVALHRFHVVPAGCLHKCGDAVLVHTAFIIHF
eukprot:XP_001708577.1 Hypothetical protein GL50803_35621 [Giardia lamblia ATCC 50803]